MSDYRFSVDWFTQHIDIWTKILPETALRAKKILEIGSYEGRSTAWLLENAVHPDGGEVYCIDTWEGGFEYRSAEMVSVEKRFEHNTAIALENSHKSRFIKLRGTSRMWLASLISRGHTASFDLVYVDGSHQAPDVLEDLVGSFQLCKVGGVIICDDYLWGLGQNPVLTPKPAIDAFINCFIGKIKLLPAPISQVFIVRALS